MTSKSIFVSGMERAREGLPSVSDSAVRLSLRRGREGCITVSQTRAPRARRKPSEVLHSAQANVDNDHGQTCRTIHTTISQKAIEAAKASTIQRGSGRDIKRLAHVVEQLPDLVAVEPLEAVG